MSTHSTVKTRTRQPKWWAGARKLHEQGLSVAGIAAALGKHRAAVRYAVMSEEQRRARIECEKRRKQNLEPRPGRGQIIGPECNHVWREVSPTTHLPVDLAARARAVIARANSQRGAAVGQSPRMSLIGSPAALCAGIGG